MNKQFEFMEIVWFGNDIEMNKCKQKN